MVLGGVNFCRCGWLIVSCQWAAFPFRSSCPCAICLLACSVLRFSKTHIHTAVKYVYRAHELISSYCKIEKTLWSNSRMRHWIETSLHFEMKFTVALKFWANSYFAQDFGDIYINHDLDFIESTLRWLNIMYQHAPKGEGTPVSRV